MNISGTFKRSWQLFRGALQVMMENKKLLLFPALSTVFSIGVVLFFLIPVVTHSGPGGARFIYFDNTPQHQWHLTQAGYVCAAAFYLVMMFLTTFCNVAFYSQIMNALSGRGASLSAGFSFAVSRLRQIIVWSLFAGVIGLIISTLEQRFGWVGRIVLRVIGMVWSVASCFAIPVIIHDESCNPIYILKSSAQTIKKTWGELLVGFVGIQLGIVMLLLILPIVIGIPLCMSFYQTNLSPTVFFTIIFTGLGIWITLMFIVSYFTHVANDIYRCALFLYATQGVTSSAFSTELLNSAWKTKKKK
ncbi:MAG: DUF6159 family protein [Chthoniobacterales bacterium]